MKITKKQRRCRIELESITLIFDEHMKKAFLETEGGEAMGMDLSDFEEILTDYYSVNF